MSSTTTNITAYREKLSALLQNLPESERIPVMRRLARTDLFFLLRHVLNRPDIEHPWLFDRCKEVQEQPNGYLDLWAREHYKSTIITFGKTIQDVLASHGDDPLPEWNGIEPTFGIFSCTRPIAKGFLRQIKREFESNALLLELFPDVIWANPDRDAPKWSEDDGLILKRKSNPKESTVEAWGLVDGQPTSKHFTVRVYDDVVTLDSVRSTDVIKKTTEAWEVSLNLGTSNGFERYIGTRYHLHDTYKEMLKREAAIPRVYPGTDNGQADGNPVFFTQETLTKKRKKMGSYVFACQILQNPQADSEQSFKREWVRFYDKCDPSKLRKIMIVDPANEKKKHSDYTALWVIGIGEDERFRVLDIVRDKLNLTERAKLVIDLHRKWRPADTYYEQYGMQSDIQFIETKQNEQMYSFTITPVAGNMAKNDRIRKLIPLFEEGRILFPRHLNKRDYEGKDVDLVETFLKEEYDLFPLAGHDDLLDGLARIADPNVDVSRPNLDFFKPIEYDAKRYRWVV